MPYFGGSPFDTDVERATSELKTEEDWALIIEICDKINGTPSGPKDAMKSLMKRLKHSSSRVVLHALALLGACVDNCGKSFQIELCSREFYNFAFHALRKPDAVQVALSSRLKEMIQDWVVAFEGDSKLGLMKKLYVDLKSEGVIFNEHNADKAIGLHTSNASSNGTRNGTSSSTGPSYQDDIDLARAIELSLQEASESSAATPTSSGIGDSAIYPSLYPSPSAPAEASTSHSSGRKVRALYDFDAAEDNELSFKAGELINILDDSDENWWRGETLQGKGLFPANFVTLDLTAIPEPVHGSDRKSVRFSDEVAAQPKAEIREEKITLLLEMLHTAAEDNEQEETTIKELERECEAMKPLIKHKIDAIDNERANMIKLNEQFQNALRLYQQLMKDVHVSQPPPTYAYTDGAGQATMYEPTAAYMPNPGTYAPVEAASYQLPGIIQAVSGYTPVGQPPVQTHGGTQPIAPAAQTGPLSQGILSSMHGVSPAVQGIPPAPGQGIPPAPGQGMSSAPSQAMLPPHNQAMMPGHGQPAPQGQPVPASSYMPAPPTQGMAYYPVQETPGMPPDPVLGSSPGKGKFASPPNQPPAQHYLQEQPVAPGPYPVGSQTAVDGPPPPQGYDVPPGVQPMYYYGQHPVPAAGNPQPVQASLI